jgi:rubrerythrin
MKSHDNVCFTFDAACDAAIEMETSIFLDFLNAIRTVKDKAAIEILQDAATVRLGIKQKLEMAALKGGFEEQVSQGPVPTMDLMIHYCDLHQITTDADNRKALAYSIQMSKDALQFYRGMTDRCSGAPMAALFTTLGDEQTKSLQQLEDTYEEHFLTEG